MILFKIMIKIPDNLKQLYSFTFMNINHSNQIKFIDGCDHMTAQGTAT